MIGDDLASSLLDGAIGRCGLDSDSLVELRSSIRVELVAVSPTSVVTAIDRTATAIDFKASRGQDGKTSAGTDPLT